MNQPRQLRVLLVEDSEDDAFLILRELERVGFTPTSRLVQQAGAMREALLAGSWDIVISDWAMPEFSALAALALAREHAPDLPFIIVSGTIGEEFVVAALRGGAHDFVAKDKLARLVPAVERELRESRSRTARRAAEAALVTAEKARRAMETRFSRLAESGIVGVVVTDASGQVAEANEAFLQMVGRSREQMAARSLRSAEMTPPEWTVMDEVAARRLQETGVAPPWEKEYLRPDGSRVPVLVGMARLEDASTIAFVADLTERKKAEVALRGTEEQLRQAQKMEEIGRLAGGIAHDFNNLLSIILSYASMLLDDPVDPEEQRDSLTEIKKAGERAAELTHQLLAFSRQQVLEPRVIDLNQSIVQIDKMVRRIIGEDVNLRTVPAPGLWSVKVDPGQVEQVIMNLVVNARDAMPAGGTLTLETANVALDATYALSHAGITPGPHVMLAVTDSGTGMSKETQARIFEPFFTTKEKGRGTGLGLSTVFGIVKQSGGSVWVYSEPGRGTTFKVYFPRTSEGPVRRLSSTLMKASQGSETILLVEDEPQVRDVARTVLQKKGYRVIEAADASDALQRSDAFAGIIHLLVTDVVMPGMSGRELAERLSLARPQMRILYVSGYTDNTIVHHGVLEPGVSFLQKPITPDALARKVREVLDTPKE